MLKALSIARWEYLQKVKTKTFLLSVFLTPAIIILFALAPAFLSGIEEASPKPLGFIDASKKYLRIFDDELNEYKLNDGQPRFLIMNLFAEGKPLDELKKAADKKIIAGDIFGCILIQKWDRDTLIAEFRSRNLDYFKEIQIIKEVFNKLDLKLKLAQSELPPEYLSQLTKRVTINQILIDDKGRESGSNFLPVFFSSLIFIMLLMLMIIYSGGMLVRSLVEEKSNRIIEILLSSCTAGELLLGKIIGLSLIGLTQLLVWGLAASIVHVYVSFPPGVFDNIILIGLYFVLGFIFYTAIFVGVGSIVTTEQEAQQMTSYLGLVLVLPVVIIFQAMQRPDSLLIKILSYIPFTSPSVLILRLNVAKVSSLEILLTVTLMIISIYFIIIVTAKIFRLAILSHGKRPSIKEILKWVKTK